MRSWERTLIALFIVSSVSGELSVLVTGMPHYQLNQEFDSADETPAEKASMIGAKESWESTEDTYNNNNKEGAGSQAEYQRFLGIDPLANSYLTDMNLNEGSDKHMVRKRVLPFSEEEILDGDGPEDALELIGAGKEGSI